MLQKEEEVRQDVTAVQELQLCTSQVQLRG
jgi:hypothetical protein